MKKRLFIYSFSIVFIMLIIIGTINIRKNVIHIEKISFPFKQYSSVQKDGDFIYASVDSNNNGFFDKIVKYNIKTKKYNTIFQSEFQTAALQNIMVNDKWVIWLDATMDLSKIRIYCMDKNTNIKKLVYKVESRKGNMDTPYLYKDYISWVGFDEKDEAYVFLYNINKNQLLKLYKLEHVSFYNTFIHMNEDKLLWTDNIDNKGYYFILDLKNKKINKYKSNYLFPGYAQISNDLIFSINFNNYRDWCNQEFGCFDINANKYIPIKIKEYINRFRVKDNILVILNKHNHLEIYDINKSLNKTIMEINKPVDEIYFTSDNKLIYTTINENNEKEIYLLNNFYNH